MAHLIHFISSNASMTQGTTKRAVRGRRHGRGLDVHDALRFHPRQIPSSSHPGLATPFSPNLRVSTARPFLLLLILTNFPQKRHLRPGGWAEFCDYDFKYQCDDGTLTPDLAMVQNDLMVIEASARLGRTACPGPYLKGWMEQAGFINITERCYKLPIGPWPKDPRMVRFESTPPSPNRID